MAELPAMIGTDERREDPPSGALDRYPKLPERVALQVLMKAENN
jgi:hypothetical protein